MPDVRRRRGYRGFTWRIYGNYVGPGWSAGKYQKSVKSDVPPVDEFDATAKEHDESYALGKNLKEADYKFYKKNIGKGFVRSAAALAVGAQGWLRKDDSSSSLKYKKWFSRLRVPNLEVVKEYAHVHVGLDDHNRHQLLRLPNELECEHELVLRLVGHHR